MNELPLVSVTVRTPELALKTASAMLPTAMPAKFISSVGVLVDDPTLIFEMTPAKPSSWLPEIVEPANSSAVPLVGLSNVTASPEPPIVVEANSSVAPVWI